MKLFIALSSILTHNFLYIQAFRPHSSQVDSVLVAGPFVYSGGDRRVLCSDFANGVVVSTITRDSGNIPFLFEYQQELFICSTNGSIRTYALTHSGQNIKMVSGIVLVRPIGHAVFILELWFLLDSLFAINFTYLPKSISITFCLSIYIILLTVILVDDDVGALSSNYSRYGWTSHPRYLRHAWD